jgi:hypothetical protein
MVSGINGNFSLRTLEYIKNELVFISTENGEITEEAQSKLSSDAANMINYFGNNKNILTGKIDDLITQNEAKNKQTSKEAAPDMDLSLDNDIKAQKPKGI